MEALQHLHKKDFSEGKNESTVSQKSSKGFSAQRTAINLQIKWKFFEMGIRYHASRGFQKQGTCFAAHCPPFKVALIKEEINKSHASNPSNMGHMPQNYMNL
jgi:hypothetical protein